MKNLNRTVWISRPAIASSALPARKSTRLGWSLIEVLVVVTMMAILISITVPNFVRSLEQSHADIAAANLRAIWTAERLYWLENRTYSANLSQLQSLGLLDPAIGSATAVYLFQVQSPDPNSFSATATRAGSLRWKGAFTIDQTGTLTGSIQAHGEPTIVPGFQ
jgi:prepilin-type N-terminal cleavage/methylation domain-containing protein